MCDCNQLEECVEASPTRADFVKNFQLVDQAHDIWAELFVCQDCGQNWYIQVGAEADRQLNKAVKLASSENWQAFNPQLLFEQLTVNQLGSLSSNPCLAAGCSNMALHQRAVCIKHFGTPW